MPETPTSQSKSAKAETVAFRGGGFAPRPIGLVGAMVFVFLIALWEWGSRVGWISQLVLPAPSEAFAAFQELVVSGLLWKHVSASVTRLVTGWISGTVLGLLVGLSIGLFSLARAGFVPLVSAMFDIQKIAMLRLFFIVLVLERDRRSRQYFSGRFFQL